MSGVDVEDVQPRRRAAHRPPTPSWVKWIALDSLVFGATVFVGLYGRRINFRGRMSQGSARPRETSPARRPMPGGRAAVQDHNPST